MEIRTYNSAQLYDLIMSESFKHMPVIPISTHRAISHIHNPRTDKEDILMTIAYENDEMIGYLGVLADRIYTLKGEPQKCGWLSCMWVNPTLRGKGIAKQLLATVFKTWNDHILVTEFTPEAKGLYDRSGNFTDLRINEGLRCYMRFNLHEVLPKKSEKYKSYSTLLKVLDSLANIPVDLRLSLMKTKQVSSLQFLPVTEIDSTLNKYIQSKQNCQFERRSADELNWIINYPWLKQSQPTDESRRYHFSSVAQRFQNLCFKLTDKGKTKGYLHLTIRDNHLKIPYAYFEPECMPDIVQYVYQIMQEHKLNMLTVFHPDLISFFKTNTTRFIYRRAIRRNYIITKVLDSHFSEKEKLLIQDGDADCVFT
jgi:GNAT superfamily N-acetyltransferase